MDAHANLAYSLVATAPSPPNSGTSLTVTGATGTIFPSPAPFQVMVWPAGLIPTPANSEICRVTAVATDTFTIVRAQEGTSARTILVGDQISAPITKKAFDDIEAIATDPVLVVHGGTGAQTAAGARTNIQVYSIAEMAALLGANPTPGWTPAALDLWLPTGTYSAGTLTGGVVRNASSIQLVQNYSQSVPPTDQSLGSAVRFTWHLVATDNTPFVGPNFGPIGPGVPGASFQIQGEVQVGANSTKYSFSPIGFQNSMRFKNVPGANRKMTTGWDFLSQRSFIADNGVVTWGNNDTTRGGAAFIDNQLWLTQNIGENDGTTDPTVISSFASVPFVLGHSHIDQRIAYDVWDMCGGAGPDGDPYAGVTPDFAGLTTFLNSSYPGIDAANVVLNQNIGVRICRMIGGTHNIGVMNAAGTVNVPIDVTVSAVSDTLPHHVSLITVTASSALSLTSTPTIADGLDGQTMVVLNVGANALTLKDEAVLTGSNMMFGGVSRVLNQYDSVTLVFSLDAGAWVEGPRSWRNQPGALAPSQWVGGTTTGTAPTTGTFAVGNWVTTTLGGLASIFICTAAGSPGTWAQVSGIAQNRLAFDTAWNAKGDLAVATGDNAATVLSVGTFGQTQLADSTTSTGLIYGVPDSLTTRYMKPTGSYETIPRIGLSTQSPTTSGTAILYAIGLPKNFTVTTISFVSAAVGATSPTHWWYSLCNGSYVTLRSTADQLTSAWAGGAEKPLNLSSTFTTAYEGLYYLVFMMTAGTVIQFPGTGTGGGMVGGILPFPAVTGNASLTSAPADGTNLATAAVSRGTIAYGYVK